MCETKIQRPVANQKHPQLPINSIPSSLGSSNPLHSVFFSFQVVKLPCTYLLEPFNTSHMQNTASSVESITLHDTVFVCVCVCFLPQFLEQKLVGSVLDLALKCCDDHQLPPTSLLFGNKQICIEQCNFIKHITCKSFKPLLYSSAKKPY